MNWISFKDKHPEIDQWFVFKAEGSYHVSKWDAHYNEHPESWRRCWWYPVAQFDGTDEEALQNWIETLPTDHRFDTYRREGWKAAIEFERNRPK